MEGQIYRPWHPFRPFGGVRLTINILTVISLTTVLSILFVFEKGLQLPGNTNNTKVKPRTKRADDVPTFIFWADETQTVQFDFCKVVNCGNVRQEQLTWADKYICVTEVGARKTWCPEGRYVGWNTELTHWGYTPYKVQRKWTKGENLLQRLSIVKGTAPSPCTKGQCNPLLLTLKDPATIDSDLYMLGAKVPGSHLLGQFRIQVFYHTHHKTTSTNQPIKAPSTDTHEEMSSQSPILTILNLTTLRETFDVETGYTDKNEWLNWIIYTAQQLRVSDCIVCAAARPQLGTMPFRLNPHNDPTGLNCTLQLFTSTSPPASKQCQSLHYLMPPAPVVTPPFFTPYRANYTCFLRNSTSGRKVSDLHWCNSTTNVTTHGAGYDPSWFTDHVTARADLWWYCGGNQLRPVLPPDWQGTCALIQLVMPFYVLPLSGSSLDSPHRVKRDTAAAGSFDNRVYTDAIGVPRGVPEEYKARNQVAAGFESFLFWWSTINKNVDWINYLYYNQQRFINYTRDAVRGLAEQLGKTSLMTWQNQMALDMLLAKEGGVCKMFGSACCTFIPNNTSPDGSVTRALHGLQALSEELAENAGTDNFTSWLKGMFGKWSGLVQSILISMAVMIILVTCGCCCIPCIRGLCQCLIHTAVNKQRYQSISEDDQDPETPTEPMKEDTTVTFTDCDRFVLTSELISEPSGKYKNLISQSSLLRPGSPAVYQLRPQEQKFGTLTRKTVGEKNQKKTNKTILLVGETGAGKSTLINSLFNYTIGVKVDHNIWFEIVETENRSRSESQTSDVIVYEIFGFEGETLPYSLTIIDTPGFGDTRGIEHDVIINQRLFDLFRSEDRVHELSAVGLVMKATDNRLSDRLMYVFNSVTSLFGKDLENKIVALITHSDGRKPQNALQALEAAKIQCARNEKNQPVHFLFDNCQSEERTEENCFVLETAWRVADRGMDQFTKFLEQCEPQRLTKTVEVLNSHIRLTACIQNLQDRIKLIELKQTEIKQTQEALKKHEEEMKKNKKFTIEVDEVYKDKEPTDGGMWWLVFYQAAVTCSVCKENCHYPGCTMAWSPGHCEVMKGGRCTSCSGKCPVSAHVKEKKKYVTKTKKVQKTLEEVKEKYEKNKAESEKNLSLLETLEEEMETLKTEKNQLLEEAYQHVVSLEQIALNVDSVSTYVHLDFLIQRMKEKGDTEKVRKLEEMERRVDKRIKAALQYMWKSLCSSGKAFLTWLSGKLSDQSSV